jgi:hypothetical protein
VDLPARTYHPRHGLFRSSARSSAFVDPITIALGGAGIFNLLAIAYAFRPQLRFRLTQGRRALPWKPWVFGEEDFHLLDRLLMPCIITSLRSSALYSTPSLLQTTLSYRFPYWKTRDFGSRL